MTFEEIINKNKPLINQEDYIQDCWLMKLENPEMDENKICVKCRNKYISECIRTKCTLAPSIYNDDGECLDDNYYFVDERTVEHNDFSYITDGHREKAHKLVKISELIVAVMAWNDYYYIDGKRLRRSQYNLQDFSKSLASGRIPSCNPNLIIKNFMREMLNVKIR